MNMSLRCLLCLGVLGLVAAGQPGKNPPAGRAAQEIRTDISEVNIQIDRTGSNIGNFINKEKRDETVKTAVPLLKKRLALYDELGKVAGPTAVNGSRPTLIHDMALLAVMGDDDARKTLAAAAKSAAPETAFYGALAQDLQQWIENAGDAAAQSKILDQVRQLVKTNPLDDPLAHTLLTMTGCGATPELRKAAEDIVMKDLKGPRAVAHQMYPHMNSPYTITGVTTSGKAFSSAALKGKVILVHIWDSSDPVCRLEIPELAKMLKDHAGDGLEIIGVPLDADAKALATFMAGNKDLTWTQLYDPKDHNHFRGIWGVDRNNIFLLLDRAGVVRARQGREELDKKVEELLAEKPASETKPAK